MTPLISKFFCLLLLLNIYLLQFFIFFFCCFLYSSYSFRSLSRLLEIFFSTATNNKIKEELSAWHGVNSLPHSFYFSFQHQHWKFNLFFAKILLWMQNSNQSMYHKPFEQSCMYQNQCWLFFLLLLISHCAAEEKWNKK